MFLKTVMNIGKLIRQDPNWKDNKEHFSNITQEAAEDFFQAILGISFETTKEEGLINLFYGTVALEYAFNLHFGSATPTAAILKEVGRRNPSHFETHGNWAGANRGNNPYTPFGYRYGFRSYQDLLNHRAEIGERVKNDLENALAAQEQKKALKAQQHQERLVGKRVKDDERRMAELLPSKTQANKNG